MNEHEFQDSMNTLAGTLADNSMMRDYAARHGIEAEGILTVTDDELAHGLALHLSERVKGKTVVEIGGGIGLLSLYLADHAKRVFCIEAHPMWSLTFGMIFAAKKPKNLSFLFGAADEFAGLIKADVALFCTHSGVKSMMEAGNLFAPEVIDVYGELIEGNPAAFDRTASILRKFA